MKKMNRVLMFAYFTEELTEFTIRFCAIIFIKLLTIRAYFEERRQFRGDKLHKYLYYDIININ